MSSLPALFLGGIQFSSHETENRHVHFPLCLQRGNVPLQARNRFVFLGNGRARDVAAAGHAARVQTVPVANGADPVLQLRRHGRDLVAGEAVEDLVGEVGVLAAAVG